MVGYARIPDRLSFLITEKESLLQALFSFYTLLYEGINDERSVMLVLGIVTLVLFIVTNICGGFLSFLSYGKELNKKEKILTMVPKKLPGSLVGKGVAILKNRNK